MRTALRQALQLHAGRSWDGRLPTPGFQQALTSIALDRGVGSPTFTRATTKSFVDWEGVVRTALAGEACFTGARRVRNLCIEPTEGNPTTFIATGTTPPTITRNVSQLGQTCVSIAFASGVAARADASSQVNTFTFSVTDTLMQSLSVALSRPLTGSEALHIRVDGSRGVPACDINLNAALCPTVFTRLASSANVPASGGTDNFWIEPTAALTAPLIVYVTKMMVESVTGQSNQNPSDYVSVGVLAAPFQGAGVDGVQYSATQNGNTVASNVVTAGTGAAISSATLKGYDAWQAATNLCLQSEDLTTTWTLVAATISADATTAPSGAVTADKVQEDSTTNFHVAIQSFTKAASALVYTSSFYIKQAERTWSYIQIDDGTNGNALFFNLATGVTGSNVVVGTGFTSVSASITPAANGFYRCTVTATSSAATTLRLLVGPATGDTVRSYLGTTGSGVFAWGAQLEQVAFATPYIATTTAAVTRNSDVLSYPSAGNFDPTQGAAYAELTQTVSVASSCGALGFNDSNGRALYNLGTNDRISCFDGTTAITVTGLNLANTTKGASSWGAAGMRLVASGAVPTAQPFDGAMGGAGSLIQVGTITGPSTSWNGNIRNVRIWNRALINRNLSGRTV